MKKKSCPGLVLVFLVLGFFPAAGLDLSIHLSPLVVWPIGPAESEGDEDSLFAASVGGELSLGFTPDESWEVRAGLGLLPLILNVDDQGSDGLLASAKAGLGLRLPFAGQSTVVLGGAIGVYQLEYKGTHYSTAFCFDLEARVHKDVAPWLSLFCGMGYSSYLVEFSNEALFNAVHLKAGLSILLYQP